jgi:hypothetical protein
VHLLSEIAGEVNAFDSQMAALHWTKRWGTHFSALDSVWSDLNRYEALFQVFSITLAGMRETLFALAHPGTPLAAPPPPNEPNDNPAGTAVRMNGQPRANGRSAAVSPQMNGSVAGAAAAANEEDALLRELMSGSAGVGPPRTPSRAPLSNGF